VQHAAPGRVKFRAVLLSDHVFVRLPVRQWVLSDLKRLRYYTQRDGPAPGMVLRIFLRFFRKRCKPTALVRSMWTRQHCTQAQSPSSTASAPASMSMTSYMSAQLMACLRKWRAMPMLTCKPVPRVWFYSRPPMCMRIQ